MRRPLLPRRLVEVMAEPIAEPMVEAMSEPMAKASEAEDASEVAEH